MPYDTPSPSAPGLYSNHRRGLEEHARRIAPNGYRCVVCQTSVVVFQRTCPGCDSRATLVLDVPRERVLDRLVTPESMGVAPVVRVRSGVPCLDLVMGGAIATRTVNVILGKRGCGKSTLVLQGCLHTEAERPLYISAEESKQELQDRMSRLGDFDQRRLKLLFTKDAREAMCAIREYRSDFVGIDSLQKFHDPTIDGVPEGIVQIKHFVAELYSGAKDLNGGYTVLAVSRVTSAMAAVGGSAVEYDPDAVIALLRGPGTVRVLRPKKNRYGAPDDIPTRLTASGMELDVVAYDRIKNRGRFDEPLDEGEADENQE